MVSSNYVNESEIPYSDHPKARFEFFDWTMNNGGICSYRSAKHYTPGVMAHLRISDRSDVVVQSWDGNIALGFFRLVEVGRKIPEWGFGMSGINVVRYVAPNPPSGNAFATPSLPAEKWLQSPTKQTVVSTLTTPAWIPLVVFTLCPSSCLFIRLFRRYRRLLRGRCVECGYDLTGNMSRACPECGKNVPIQPISPTIPDRGA